MPLKKVGTAGFEPATSALSRQRSKPTELSPDKSYCDVVKQKNILQEECFLVGAAGFEPATPWSQTRCANRTAPRPEIFITIINLTLLSKTKKHSPKRMPF